MPGYGPYANLVPGSGGGGQAGNYSYYTPGTSYGGNWAPGEFNQTPFGNQYLEQERGASFVRFMAENGWDDRTTRGQWGADQFGRLDRGYEAALGDNPALNFRDFLQLEGPKLDQFYDSLTSRQRGENPGLVSGRVRQQFRR